jgi:hypothetical protein
VAAQVAACLLAKLHQTQTLVNNNNNQVTTKSLAPLRKTQLVGATMVEDQLDL